MAVVLNGWMDLLQVSDAEKNTEVSDIMMSRYNVYVQAINYPTVARGEELLRIAPTPHHTPQMMTYFVGKGHVRSSWLVCCEPLVVFSTRHKTEGNVLRWGGGSRVQLPL